MSFQPQHAHASPRRQHRSLLVWLNLSGWPIMLVAIALTGLLFGCQNVTNKAPASDEAAPADEAESKAMTGADYRNEASRADEEFPAAPAANEERTVDAVAPSAGGAADDQKPAKPRPDRMIVYHAWLTVVVHEVDRTLKEAVTLVEDAGGYVEASTRRSRVLRIPSQHYHETMSKLKKLGDVRHVEQRSRDITEQFTNLVARIENLQALEKRYEEMLARATTLKDRLAIERELRRISKELEQLQAQRRAMKNLADFATVELTVEQKQSDMVAQRDRPAQPFGWVEGYGLTGVLQ